MVSCVGLLSTMCFTVTVFAVWSTDTSSPAKFLAAGTALAASCVAAAGAAGVAGAAGFAPWAKAVPAMAGTATAATSRCLKVFIRVLLEGCGGCARGPGPSRLPPSERLQTQREGRV